MNKRFIQHNQPNDSIKLYNALQKYGFNNAKIELLTVCGTQETADYWENYFTVTYDSRNREKGYNLREAGSRGKHSEESKRKISNTLQMLLETGWRAHTTPHTEETKNKISEAKKSDLENTKRLQTLCIGRVVSDEERKMRSEAALHGDDNPGKKFKGRTWKLINGKRVWL
jgi:NUMOD3 motif